MKTIIKSTLALLLVAAAAPGLSLDRKITPWEKFAFQNREYQLLVDGLPGRTDIILKGGVRPNLSAGMAGENIPLATRQGSDNFYVFWLNNREETIRLAYYDFKRDRSQVLTLDGFSFIGLPEIVEENNNLQGLVFLGNRAQNDDIFYYEPENDLLTQLTATPFSEKGFTLLENNGRLEIETRSLWAQYRYAFDPSRRQCAIREIEDRPARPRKTVGPKTPQYYNTFIGFGDSITWGEFEGEQRQDICFLTQMKTLMDDPAYASFYGLSYPINLGVPGDTTLAGAERIDEELANYSGFYFLLMLGINDAIANSMSIDSSLENLEYIIDAAASYDMRIIVSTLTPSKSVFAQFDYFWHNLQDLQSGILALAEEKEIVCVDTLDAFMNTNPPDGWRDLLEDVFGNVSSGNHPNQVGHRLIADLFAAALVAFPPLGPTGVSVIDPKNPLKRDVQWDANFESDFSHFAIEFAFSAKPLSHKLTTDENHFSFTLFPFLPQLYFRLQTVDGDGHASDFTAVFPAQAEKSGGQ